jgi:hypothetical protein
MAWLGAVVHTCNLSCSGGKDRITQFCS